MDKRDLEKIVKDANWKELHERLNNESDIHIRSSIDRLIDIFADIRIDKRVRIKPWRSLYIQDEVHLILKFNNGRYKECICILGIHHMKRYIHSIVPTLTDDELEDAKWHLLQGEHRWKRGTIELRYENKKPYSL